MYKILAIGSTSNYFFSEIVKVFSQQHNVVLNDLNMVDNVDFIFCVNDIKPVLKTTKVPVVTWLGERPSYPYLNKVLKLRQSDLILWSVYELMAKETQYKHMFELHANQYNWENDINDK